MTLDRIKIHTGNQIFDYWCDLINTDALTYQQKKDYLNKAKNNLESEINNNLLIGVNYVAELKLINYLLGIK